MGFTLVKVDVSKVEGLGNRLGELSGEAIGAAIVASLNHTADTAYDLARTRMLANINLSDEYLRRKMVVEHATNNKLEASITARGTQTLLSEYLGLQKDVAVNWSNARIAAMGHKFGKWPGWTRRTGNPKLGISENKKAAGQSASVTRGSRDNFPHVFSIPGKVDGSGNWIMFTSKKGGGKEAKIRALLGPAAYQLFRTQLPNIEGEVADDLSEELLAAVEEQMKKVLSE